MSKRRTQVGSIIKRTFDWNWAYKDIHREFKCLWMTDDDLNECWYIGEFDISDPYYIPGSLHLVYSGSTIQDPCKIVKYSSKYRRDGSIFCKFDQYSDNWK